MIFTGNYVSCLQFLSVYDINLYTDSIVHADAVNTADMMSDNLFSGGEYMQDVSAYEYRIIESDIADIHLNTILDQGFFRGFEMSPELHCHGYYEVLCSMEDSFFLDMADGVIKEMKKGEFCLLPPGTYHGNRPCSEHSKKLAFRFRYTKNGKLDDETSLYQLFHAAMSSCCDPVFFAKEDDLMAVIDFLQQELNTEENPIKEYTEALLHQFYLLLMRKIYKYMSDSVDNPKSGVANDKDLRRILIEDYFLNYYSENITEDHMAEQIRLSRRQLSRVLREIYGKSFRELLIEERLHHAAQLLIDTNMPIDKICDAVGYTSLSGFYSAFKLKFGTTAGKYRKKMLKNKQNYENGTRSD